jgi:myxalamid-type polyketide synthase MxaB
VAGAWHLHELTAGQPLDFFALFSSVACVLGSPGQANYAAGNAFLDGLCSYRHAVGLPATAVNWGPWAGSGMAAEAGREAQLAERGMNLLPSEQALELLGQLLRLEEKVPATLAVSARWGAMLKNHRGPRPSLLREVAPAEGDAPAAAADRPEDAAFREQLAGLDLAGREAALRQFFSQQLAQIMGLDAGAIDQQQPLNSLGLDSLMAVELKINIETRLKITIPMAQFMESPSVASLAKYVAKTVGGGGVNGGRSTGRPTAPLPATRPRPRRRKRAGSRCWRCKPPAIARRSSVCIRLAATSCATSSSSATWVPISPCSPCKPAVPTIKASRIRRSTRWSKTTSPPCAACSPPGRII